MFKFIKNVVLVAALIFTAHLSYAAIDAYDFDSEQKAQEFRELTLQLRCPKCQNNSIGDSNAIIATDMRAKVYELMQEGYTKQQIIDYMIERYGNFVTYQPPMNAATLILWLGPLLFLGFGILFVVRMSRKKATNDVSNELAEQESERLARLLDEKNDSQRGNQS